MIGKSLGHYRILGEIGRGGMGVVYRARDEHLDRDVAIKVLIQGAIADGTARQRFRKEALALSRLNHPNIATIHDFETVSGIDFLVMEYIPGATLSERVAAGPLDELEVVRLGTQLARALTAAHARGIVHRDLKPSNVRVTPDGLIKVLDFGLVQWFRLSTETATTVSAADQSLWAGTLAYMAPEGLRGAQPNPRMDVYAAGMTLYEMATGRLPFAGQSGPALISAILGEAPPPPNTINRRVSPGLSGIIVKSLEKDPDRRYQSARELQVDLERLAAPAPPPPALPRPFFRHWRVWTGVAVALLAAAWIAADPGGWRERAVNRISAVRGAPAARSTVRSIAILPFTNRGSSTEYDYFGLGLSDVLNAKLTNARFIEVRAPRSAWTLVNGDVDAVEFGRRLGVDTVLEGSYQIEGGTLSLSYTLTDVRQNVRLAGDAVQDAFTNTIAVEHRIAEQIVSSLQLSTGPEARTLTSPVTERNEAFQAYLRSRYEMELFWREPSAEQLQRVEYHLREALRHDRAFPLALVSLAALDWNAISWGYAKGPDTLAHAEQSARVAIERAPEYGAAYAALGLVYFQRGEWEQARRYLREGFSRSPNAPLVSYAAGFYYMGRGLPEYAVRAFLRARELDPELVRREVGLAYRYKADFRNAEAQLREDLERYPADVATAAALTHVLVALGKLDAARESERISLQRWGHDPAAQAAIAILRVRERKPFSIHDWLARYGDVYWADGGGCANVASVYAAAGNPGEAIRWLRRGAELNMRSYPFVSGNPLYATLNGNPAFDRYLEGLRLEWELNTRREAEDPLLPASAH